VIHNRLVPVVIAFIGAVVCSFIIISSGENISQYSNSVNTAYATSVNDIYVFTFSNKTGDDELMFKSSTDGGLTFSNTVSLMNSTNPNPKDVEISANNKNIIISWFERNASGKQTLNDKLLNDRVTLGIVLLRLQNESNNKLN
jgi:hypothetical protein